MNPVLRELGYAQDERVVIFHADDIGMCQSTLPAYQELLDFGLLSSASVMVPCPWFSGLAEIIRERDDVDMGVHLTITSEWDNYRWSSISTSDKATGLFDDAGYFYQDCEAIQENGDPQAVVQEIYAQIERAIRAGIDVTHVDSHMGALFHEKFLQAYFDAGLKYHLPMLLSRSSQVEMEAFGLSEAGIQMTKQIVQQMDKQHIAVFDQIYMMDLDEVWDDGIAQTIDLIGKIPAGLTYFIIHPAKDTPELRAIAPDWEARVRDYEAFKSVELQDYVQNSGIRVIGYKVLRDRMRA